MSSLSLSFQRYAERALAVSALSFAITCSAWAGDSKVSLSGKDETPPVTTAATGLAEIKISPDKKVSGAVQTSGVEGTAAHIHLGAPGEKGPPVVSLEKGISGTWRVPEGATLTDEQYAAYQAGKLYVNVHSGVNKGGEIRGQLKP